jgi:hypothetical protein
LVRAFKGTTLLCANPAGLEKIIISTESEPAPGGREASALSIKKRIQ